MPRRIILPGMTIPMTVLEAKEALKKPTLISYLNAGIVEDTPTVEKVMKEKKSSESISFPKNLSDESHKTIMKYFGGVSPFEDSVAIVEKNDATIYSPKSSKDVLVSRIRDDLVKLFRKIYNDKKITKEKIFDSLPYDRNYIYYNPNTKVLRVDKESRL